MSNEIPSIEGYVLSGNIHPSSSVKKTVKYISKEREKIEKIFTPNLEEMKECPLTPTESENYDLIRESLKIKKNREKTVLFAIAINVENKEENVLSHIRCYGGQAIGGYARDHSKDCYVFSCVEFIQLGSMPFSYTVSFDNVGNWKMRVPIPKSVLDRSFTPQQEKIIEDFKTRRPSPKYEIHYVQIVGCN